MKLSIDVKSDTLHLRFDEFAIIRSKDASPASSPTLTPLVKSSAARCSIPPTAARAATGANLSFNRPGEDYLPTGQPRGSAPKRPMPLRSISSLNRIVGKIACGVIILALAACEKVAPPPVPATAVVVPAAAPAGSATVPASVQKILGRWQRTDGDYTLAISGGENGGTLRAEYFNPKSIHVSRAAWIESGSRLQLLVELTDVGYPGATYTLHHDAATDRLVGQYKQPAQQQIYDIEFTRQTSAPQTSLPAGEGVRK